MKAYLLILTATFFLYKTDAISQVTDEEPVFIDIESDDDKPDRTVNIGGKEYQITQSYNREFKTVTDGKLIGVINFNSQFIINPEEYDKIFYRSFGIKVRKNKKYGLFDFEGKEVIPIIMESISRKEKGIAEFQTPGGKRGLYHVQTKEVTDTNYCAFISNFENKEYMKINGV